nr:Chain BBB, Tau 301-312 [Lama glama]8OP0_B Chain B, Tau PHF6 peptide [Homo sapiens]8OPI_B Chain B, PHF6 Tau peptide [Homo sapiens]8PII_B Chain B, Microtubule-associated protein tau [Homo sapiens]
PGGGSVQIVYKPKK